LKRFIFNTFLGSAPSALEDVYGSSTKPQSLFETYFYQNPQVAVAIDTLSIRAGPIALCRVGLPSASRTLGLQLCSPGDAECASSAIRGVSSYIHHLELEVLSTLLTVQPLEYELMIRDKGHLPWCSCLQSFHYHLSISGSEDLGVRVKYFALCLTLLEALPLSTTSIVLHLRTDSKGLPAALQQIDWPRMQAAFLKLPGLQVVHFELRDFWLSSLPITERREGHILIRQMLPELMSRKQLRFGPFYSCRHLYRMES